MARAFTAYRAEIGRATETIADLMAGINAWIRRIYDELSKRMAEMFAPPTPIEGEFGPLNVPQRVETIEDFEKLFGKADAGVREVLEDDTKRPLFLRVVGKEIGNA